MAKIEIDEAQLKEILEQQKQLIAQNQKLVESANQPAENRRIARANRKNSVRVTFVNDKAVIGYANKGSDNKPLFVYEKVDPNDRNKRILYVDLILDGEKDPITVEYKEFLEQSENVLCEVKHVDEKEWVIEQGTVKETRVKDYRAEETGLMVPVEIVGKTRLFVVDNPKTGEELRLHESFVNITGTR